MAAYLLTLAGALTISSAPVLFALSRTHPTVGAMGRFIYALPFLTALCVAQARGRASFRTRGWIGIAAMSGLFFSGDMGMWHHSITLIGAGPATLLVNTQVLWVTLFGAAVLGERPAPWFWAALPVAFAGMYLLSGGTLEGIAGESDRLGLALATAAGVCYAGMLVTLRSAGRRAAVAPEAVLIVQLTVSLAVLSLVGWGEGSLPAELDGRQHAWLLALGVGVQVIGWLTITHGIARLPGHHGAMLLLAQPVSSLVLGWLILDQSLSPVRIAGAVLVLAGIATAVLSERG